MQQDEVATFVPRQLYGPVALHHLLQTAIKIAEPRSSSDRSSALVSVCGGGGARGGGKEKESVGKRACLKIRKMLREANESRECYLWGSSERDPDSFV